MTKKIQGSASRYAHRKHRASTKVRAAASLRSRASPCQAGNSLQGNEKKKKRGAFSQKPPRFQG